MENNVDCKIARILNYSKQSFPTTKSKSEANTKTSAKETVESDDDLDTDEEEQVQVFVDDEFDLRNAAAEAEEATQS